ncbi:hypothetical protein AQJ46_45520 [Streptomyces canus]|uniref:Uncharacterized protein n=1 Tax=Streptomyces canus TaxID=58343 RepID=A0A101RLW6_9ACTN|nr:hypothetical protein [Streptomyces canus]KUN57788.1 hypothetical protein AQJ46_45520 [Streptomyces canus]
MNNLPEEREQRDEQIAELLQDGMTVEEIKRRLQTSYRAVARVRVQRGIAVPVGRTRRSREELDDLEEQAVTMLRAGATQREIYAKLRVGPIIQTQLRKEHHIPVQPRNGRKTSPADEGGPLL